MNEKNKKKESLEAYLAFVRHELGNQLFVIREGVSQILDGLGAKDCLKCNRMLKPSLDFADVMNKTIADLLSTKSFESILKKIDECETENKGLENDKREVVVIVNHLVRSPLTVIKEGLSLVVDEIHGKLAPKQKTILLDVKSNADKLITDVENILKTPWEDLPDLLEKDVRYKIE